MIPMLVLVLLHTEGPFASEGAEVRPAPGDDLVFSTYLGGEAQDACYALALDTRGRVYVAGTTKSLDYPIAGPPWTQGVAGPALSSRPDSSITLSTLDTQVGTLLFSQTFGGSGDETAYDIVVSPSGIVYACGATTSVDFGSPVANGQGPPATNRGTDAFVLRFDPEQPARWNVLVFAGSGDEIAFALGLGPGGEVYVAGETSSHDFPLAGGTDINGPNDLFLARVDFNGGPGTAVLLGGFGEDSAYDLSVGDDGDIFVAGRTSSPNFPTTDGAYDRTHNGSYDSFAVRLRDLGGRFDLIAGTFLGAPRRDEAHGIALDGSGVYLAGVARSEDFPVTPSAADPTHNGGYDSYVAKLDHAPSTLFYSTFLGGEAHDVASSIAVTSSGQAHVSGITFSTGFPTTYDAFSRELNGFADAFLTRVNAEGTRFAYSTYLGGLSWEEGASVVTDGEGLAYIAGTTYSFDFPSVPLSFDPTWNGLSDGYLAVLDPAAPARASNARYGFGWPGTEGVPSLDTPRNPLICEELVVLVGTSRNPPVPTPGWLLLGARPRYTRTPWGGHLLVQPIVVQPIVTGPEPARIVSHVPCTEALMGVAVFLQALVWDPGATHGVAFSPGLALHLGGE